MAFGPNTINFAGGAVSSLFSSQLSASALKIKAHGLQTEAENYRIAAQMAHLNKEFAKQSTEIKQTQSQRQYQKAVGQEVADIGAAGFSLAGSAGDLLRESAMQGALTHQVIGQQGLIEEAGYEAEEKTYNNLAIEAQWAAQATSDLAGKTALYGGISAAIQGVTAIATLL